MNQVIVLEKSLRGLIARWAVQQSPYTCPDGLAEVLEYVAERFRALATEEMAGTKFVRLAPTRKAIGEFLEALLFDHPQVQAWNERKNGRDGLGVVSAFSAAPDPDDDFIDLDALVQNISTSLLVDDHDCNHTSERLLSARGSR